jgi:hypothetical protein
MDGIPEQILGPRWQEVRLLDSLSKEELELWTNAPKSGAGVKERSNWRQPGKRNTR